MGGMAPVVLVPGGKDIFSLSSFRSSFSIILCCFNFQLSSEGVSEEERRQQMNSVNPKFILRNYLCQNAIEAAEAGNYEELTQLYEVLKKPYDEQPGMEKYTATPPEWANQLGVCMLSCSS